MQRFVLILTGLLILVGGYIFLFPASGSDTTFATVDDYEKARASGDLASGAPFLPACALDIEVTPFEGEVEAVSFTCPGTQPSDTYITDIEAQFTWNVELYENDRVVLKRVES